ncbi:MAG: SPOR domain-containing protein [Campylobacterota bacterium]|nr:SPOR domain-containing protein [Campylobacterota bacterium]
MEEKTELNDIILNQGNSGGGSKKILLAVASLAIILIIIVVIMNSIQSNSTQNLPQPLLPKEPSSSISQIQEVVEDDPLFEPVEVIQEPTSNDNLDKIAQKLKEDAVEKVVVIDEPVNEPVVPVAPKPVPTTTPAVKAKPATPKSSASYIEAVAKGKHYIQVGSFAKYKPNKTFLRKITNGGNSYTFHKVMVNSKSINKVLIGPFNTKNEARKALPKIRKSVIKGAFIVKV